VIGRVAAKIFIAGFLCVEAVLIHFYFRDSAITGFLALGAVWFLLDAAFVWKSRAYSPKEMRLFMRGWNLTAFLGMLWNWSHGSLLEPVIRSHT
jgi:hypothetical protein